MVRSGVGAQQRDALEQSDEPRIDAAARALIGARRIGETVADHPGAARERRLDQPVEMIDARRREQNGLAERAERGRLAAEQRLAQRFGMRRAAGLARRDRLDAAFARGAPASRRICVDLPAPSPPSSVMKRPARPLSCPRAGRAAALRSLLLRQLVVDGAGRIFIGRVEGAARQRAFLDASRRPRAAARARRSRRGGSPAWRSWRPPRPARSAAPHRRSCR